MSDLWIRVLVVIGALVIVALVAFVLRHAGRRGRPIDGQGLAPGIYLFTSGTCADCGPAREQLLEKLGPTGFREIAWEADPDVFVRVGIDVVPCTVVVGGDGSVNSYPGLPDRAISP